MQYLIIYYVLYILLFTYYVLFLGIVLPQWILGLEGLFNFHVQEAEELW